MQKQLDLGKIYLLSNFLNFRSSNQGLFKAHLELTYEFVLETGNWKPWFLVAEQKSSN